MTLIEDIKRQIEDMLGDDFRVTTNLPPNQTAWLAVPVFEVARKQQKDPNDLARSLANKLTKIEGISVAISGGYINISPNKAMILAILKDAGNPNYGSSTIGQSQKIVIEFGGPNIAKPMSIGHLRSTIIGDSLQRILRKLGYYVVSVNHLGDWGTQFGKLLVAYRQKYGDLLPRKDLTIKDLLALYVGFHDQSEKDPNLDDQARALFKKLEDGDPEVRALWQHFVDLSLTEFNKIFTRLDVTMDEPRMGESSYEHMLGDIIKLAQQKGIAQESEGALIVRVNENEAPLILEKSDGATVYATRDLAQVKYRVDTYHPNQILYVVANEQALHFRQYFAVARMLGIAPESVELVHVKFGLLRLAQGKMSTRKGRVVFLEDVLDQAVNKAKQVIEQKNSQLSEQEKNTIAEVIGIGAVKYFDLSHDRNHDIVFDWDQVLNLSGNSAPYLQYSYTRAKGILAKVPRLQDLELVVTDVESDLNQIIKTLANFPLVIREAGEHYKPHLLANYLNTLAAEFHSFYEQFPILKAPEDEKALRLQIVAGVANTIKIGLELLGIKVVEKM